MTNRIERSLLIAIVLVSASQLISVGGQSGQSFFYFFSPNQPMQLSAQTYSNVPQEARAFTGHTTAFPNYQALSAGFPAGTASLSSKQEQQPQSPTFFNAPSRFSRPNPTPNNDIVAVSATTPAPQSESQQAFPSDSFRSFFDNPFEFIRRSFQAGPSRFSTAPSPPSSSPPAAVQSPARIGNVFNYFRTMMPQNEAVDEDGTLTLQGRSVNGVRSGSRAPNRESLSFTQVKSEPVSYSVKQFYTQGPSGYSYTIGNDDAAAPSASVNVHSGPFGFASSSEETQQGPLNSNNVAFSIQSAHQKIDQGEGGKVGQTKGNSTTATTEATFPSSSSSSSIATTTTEAAAITTESVSSSITNEMNVTTSFDKETATATATAARVATSQSQKKVKRIRGRQRNNNQNNVTKKDQEDPNTTPAAVEAGFTTPSLINIRSEAEPISTTMRNSPPSPTTVITTTTTTTETPILVQALTEAALNQQADMDDEDFIVPTTMRPIVPVEVVVATTTRPMIVAVTVEDVIATTLPPIQSVETESSITPLSTTSTVEKESEPKMIPEEPINTERTISPKMKFLTTMLPAVNITANESVPNAISSDDDNYYYDEVYQEYDEGQVTVRPMMVVSVMQDTGVLTTQRTMEPISSTEVSTEKMMREEMTVTTIPPEMMRPEPISTTEKMQETGTLRIIELEPMVSSTETMKVSSSTEEQMLEEIATETSMLNHDEKVETASQMINVTSPSPGGDTEEHNKIVDQDDPDYAVYSEEAYEEESDSDEQISQAQRAALENALKNLRNRAFNSTTEKPLNGSTEFFNPTSSMGPKFIRRNFELITPQARTAAIVDDRIHQHEEEDQDSRSGVIQKIQQFRSKFARPSSHSTTKRPRRVTRPPQRFNANELPNVNYDNDYANYDNNERPNEESDIVQSQPETSQGALLTTSTTVESIVPVATTEQVTIPSTRSTTTVSPPLIEEMSTDEPEPIMSATIVTPTLEPTAKNVDVVSSSSSSVSSDDSRSAMNLNNMASSTEQMIVSVSMSTESEISTEPPTPDVSSTEMSAAASDREESTVASVSFSSEGRRGRIRKVKKIIQRDPSTLTTSTTTTEAPATTTASSTTTTSTTTTTEPVVTTYRSATAIRTVMSSTTETMMMEVSTDVSISESESQTDDQSPPEKRVHVGRVRKLRKKVRKYPSLTLDPKESRQDVSPSTTTTTTELPEVIVTTTAQPPLTTSPPLSPVQPEMLKKRRVKVILKRKRAPHAIPIAMRGRYAPTMADAIDDVTS